MLTDSGLPILDAILTSDGLPVFGYGTEGLVSDGHHAFNLIAGIDFDAASNSGYQTAQSTYSWSHTNAGDFLAVDIALLTNAGTAVSGITYNGVALSQIGARSSAANANRIECWGLVAPAVGTYTIAVTLTASCNSVGTSVSYSNVHQVSPVEAFNSAQATAGGVADAEVAITPVADDCWIHGAISTTDTTIDPYFSWNSRSNVSGASGSGATEDVGPVSPGAHTVIYSLVGGTPTHAIAGYAIRPNTAAALAGFFARWWYDLIGKRHV